MIPRFSWPMMWGARAKTPLSAVSPVRPRRPLRSLPQMPQASILRIAASSGMSSGTGISRKIIEASPDLRIIAKATVGVDEIDMDACNELGVLVTHAPVESNWGNIAEVTVAMMLSLLKGLQQQDQTIKEGGWWTPGKQG